METNIFFSWFQHSNYGIVLLKSKYKDSSKWNRTKKLEVSCVGYHCDGLDHLYCVNFNQLLTGLKWYQDSNWLMDKIWDKSCHEYADAMQLLQIMCDRNIGNC